MARPCSARPCWRPGHAFDSREAHSAVYDAERTAELFCTVVNRWRQLELFERNHGGIETA